MGDDTGWKDPSAEGDTYSEWTNPHFAYVSDDNVAQGNGGAANENDYYNFRAALESLFAAIPVGATIDGIQIDVEAYWFLGSTDLELCMTWDDFTTLTSTEAHTLPDGPGQGYTTYGGPTDKWDREWSKSDFADANFRVYCKIQAGISNIYIDHIRIKVFYTEGGQEFFEEIDDTLSLSDSRKLAFKPKLADSPGISDSLSTVAAYKRTPADTQSLSDLLATIATYKRAAVDTQGISDLLEHLKKIILGDQAGISDSLAPVASYKRSPDDSFSIGDALQHKKKLSLGDSFSVGDGLTKEARIPIDELLSIADALKKTFKTSFSDTLSISDILTIGVLEEALFDTLTISDLLELKWKISLGEVLSIADQLLVARVFYLADTLAISDSLAHKFIVPGGLSDLTETPALIVTKCYAIADDVPKTEKLRVWARAKDGKEKVIYIDPA